MESVDPLDFSNEPNQLFYLNGKKHEIREIYGESDMIIDALFRQTLTNGRVNIFRAQFLKHNLIFYYEN